MENQTVMSETKRLKIAEAAVAMKCSAASVYNRIKKHGWQHDKDVDGNAWVWVPVEYLSNESQAVDNLRQFPGQAETSESEPSSTDSLALDKVISILEKNYEDRIKDKEALIEAKEQVLASQKAQLDAMNNQLQAAQRQLMVIRDKNKEQNSKREKPWYKFWE